MLRIVHVSDIHFWKYPRNPLHLLNKRIVGVGALALGRARRFRLERVRSLVERVESIQPDHILISGDLTTTALDVEFRMAKTGLADWLRSGKITVIPGNHDRYTGEATRHRRFERYFGEYAPELDYPWVRWIDDQTGILALDPTRPGLTAHGLLSSSQLEALQSLLESPIRLPNRLVVACHYPLEAPAGYRADLQRKALRNAAELMRILEGAGRHLYCCGHVHAAWAFIPKGLPNQLCLNAGSPLLLDPMMHEKPGFLEMILDAGDVRVSHHAWVDDGWKVDELWLAPEFFG